MAFSVCGTRKVGGKATEYSTVPDKWVDESKKRVYFPRNKLRQLSKDGDSIPDVSSWMVTDLIKVYGKNLTIESADQLLDVVIDQSDSDSSQAKKPRLNLHHPKVLPISTQYSLYNADGQQAGGVSSTYLFQFS